jgi:hypothetical protein
MKRQWINIIGKLTLMLGLLALAGCMQMSELESDKSAGVNGGFEVTKNGLPVNWLMYTPNTVRDGEFDIIIDNSDFKEGIQSLRFDVVNCSSTGGWHSPGFTNEFFDSGRFEGEGTYKLGFWIKNDGTKFRVEAGGVSPYKGGMKVLIESVDQIEDWKYLEYKINVLKERHLRMELNILTSGTLWIDDIQIVKI